MAIYYKQMFGKIKNGFTVVEILRWVNDSVLLKDVRSGIKYVLTSDEFLQFHEPLNYDCDVDDYNGPDLGRLLN